MNPLQTIQQKLKAPKSQYNSFGKYHYRNQEDILEAVKPLLAETDSVLTITDEIVEIGGSLFVKSTATLSYQLEKTIFEAKATAYAMHAKEQKGLHEAQITGAASSYSRKYALNGLFLIDDARDSDASNDGTKVADKKTTSKKAPVTKEEKIPATTSNPQTTEKKELPWLNPGTPNWTYCVDRIKKSKGTESPVTIEIIEKNFKISKANRTKLEDETNS